jgi:hypothetical protein
MKRRHVLRLAAVVCLLILGGLTLWLWSSAQERVPTRRELPSGLVVMDWSEPEIRLLEVPPATDFEWGVFAQVDRKSATIIPGERPDPEALAIINGGYFELNRKMTPVGLEKSRGSISGEHDRGAVGRGSIVMAGHSFDLCWADELDQHRISSATGIVQCSPILVDQGRAQPWPGNDRARRSFVMTSGPIRFLGVASSISLNELGVALVRIGKRLGRPIDRALNLDGGPSTGLWIAGLPSEGRWTQQSPSRNWIRLSNTQ